MIIIIITKIRRIIRIIIIKYYLQITVFTVQWKRMIWEAATLSI